MHFKDGTPAKLGDVFVHDNGSVGIIIGGQIGSDYCSTQCVVFQRDGQWSNPVPAYVGVLRDGGTENKVVAHAAVAVVSQQALQTREMLKIGHVDIGHG